MKNNPSRGTTKGNARSKATENYQQRLPGYVTPVVTTTLTFDTNKSLSLSGLNSILLATVGNVFGVIITLTLTGTATLSNDFKILDGQVSGTSYLTMTYFGANDVRVRIYQTIDGALFLPTIYSNNVLLLDGADAASVTSPGGVLTWADKSVFLNTATQSDATHKPTYSTGSKGFNFSTSNPGSNFSLTNQLLLNRKSSTLFFVFNQSDVGNQFIFSVLVNGAAVYIMQRTTSNETYYQGRVISNNVTFNGNIVLCIKCNTAGVYNYKNGVLDNNISANSSGTDLWDEIGTFAGSTSAQFRGLIESIVIYDRDLTTAEIAATNNYLLNRFVTPTSFIFDNYINNDTNVYVYLLAGQSNAQGHGAASLLPSTLQAAQIGAKIYDYNYNKWSDIVAGTNTLTIANDFGFEVTFTSSMVKYKGRNIYIIKYAVGSSYLAFTGSSDWNVATTGAGSLLEAFKANVVLAVKVLTSQGKTPVYKGFLWMQGEQDATNQTYANAYQVNLQNLISNVRTYFATPALPFVIYQIRGVSADAAEVYSATVKAAQATVGAQANNYFIDTSTYTILSGDPPHWDENGLRQGGTDGYNVLKDL